MTMFDAFLIAYIVVSAVAFETYMPRLVGFCYAFKKPPYKKAAEKRRIGIIVPARNESNVIGGMPSEKRNLHGNTSFGQAKSK